MRSFDNTFWDRDDPALSALLDERVDMLAGLRVVNFAAGANLKMTVPMSELNRWRKTRKNKLGITACVSAAVRWALGHDPLFASLFDGRDELIVPSNPSIGVGLDAGKSARVLVVRGDEYSNPLDLAEKIESNLLRYEPIQSKLIPGSQRTKISGVRKTKRWLKMATQEVRERFDYLLPQLQGKRFDKWVEQRGHMQIHNLGTHGVQEFKGFLRRPWVSMLWVLEKDEIVNRTDSGGFESVVVLPLIMVYAQELITVDRACAFLQNVVKVLSEPAKYLERKK